MTKKRKQQQSPGPVPDTVGELLKTDSLVGFLESLAGDKNIKGMVVLSIRHDGSLRCSRFNLNKYEVLGVIEEARCGLDI